MGRGVSISVLTRAEDRQFAPIQKCHLGEAEVEIAMVEKKGRRKEK